MTGIRIIRPILFCGALLFSLTTAIPAQTLGKLVTPGKTAAAKPTDETADPLKRTTPRSTMYKFLEACHANDFTLAAQYLDLSRISANRRASEGPELAKTLADLLDRNARFEVLRLSDSPKGETEQGLPAGLNTLARFEVNGEPVALHLQQVQQAGIPVWLVSAASVAEIPELGSLTGEREIEKHLPAPLVNIQWIGTPLWVWIALVLVAVLLSLLSRLLSRLVIALMKPLAARYAKTFHVHRLEALTEPLRLILSVIVFRACMAIIGPGALFRDYLVKLLVLLFALGLASLIMRLVDVLSDTITTRLDPREYALSYSIIPLIVRSIKICIFAVGVLFVLSRWGYNTDAILAGLGVGGIAVALAAQKTIENLFGGVSLIIDRPVLVGDFCQFGGQVGTIEDIGLRSTRIRTLDRTVVTVPNSQFSTMTLENMTKRDRMWFHPTIRLRRDTLPEQVKEMMEAITNILKGHEQVDPTDVPLRFTKITEQSLDLDIFAYVLTPDYNVYLRVQTELLLQILDAAHKLGVGFAVPFQEEYNVSVDTEHMNGRFPYQAVQKQSDGTRPGVGFLEGQ